MLGGAARAGCPAAWTTITNPTSIMAARRTPWTTP